jgi:hypothetical protein
MPLMEWLFVCDYSVFVCTYQPCDGLITRPRSPTDCLRLKKIEVKRSVSWCRMLRVGATGIKPDRRRYWSKLVLHISLVKWLHVIQTMYITWYVMWLNLGVCLLCRNHWQYLEENQKVQVWKTVWDVPQSVLAVPSMRIKVSQREYLLKSWF